MVPISIFPPGLFSPKWNKTGKNGLWTVQVVQNTGTHGHLWGNKEVWEGGLGMRKWQTMRGVRVPENTGVETGSRNSGLQEGWERQRMHGRGEIWSCCEIWEEEMTDAHSEVSTLDTHQGRVGRRYCCALWGSTVTFQSKERCEA